MSKVRYVFDTNVIISSLLSEGSNPDLAIRYALQNGNILFSLELIEEIDEVLSRAKFRKYITDRVRASKNLANYGSYLGRRLFLITPTLSPKLTSSQQIFHLSPDRKLTT